MIGLVVSYKDGLKLDKKNQYAFFERSELSNNNVNNTFNSVIKDVLKNEMADKKSMKIKRNKIISDLMLELDNS